MKKFTIIMLIFIGIVIYDLYRSPLDEQVINDDLVEFIPILEELSSSLGVESITLSDHYIRPSDISEPIPEDIKKKMNEADIYRIYYGCYSGSCRASFSPDKLITFIGYHWYYLYDSKGIIEEHVVSSIKEALDTKKLFPPIYCERAKLDNWFLCVNADV